MNYKLNAIDTDKCVFSRVAGFIWNRNSVEVFRK